jgi:hypothetical protein
MDPHVNFPENSHRRHDCADDARARYVGVGLPGWASSAHLGRYAMVGFGPHDPGWHLSFFFSFHVFLLLFSFES